jgi:hypothetical protein
MRGTAEMARRMRLQEGRSTLPARCDPWRAGAVTIKKSSLAKEPTMPATPEQACSRRAFLGATAVSATSLLAAQAAAQTAPQAKPGAEPEPPRRPLRVASINSIFRFRSHAYHIDGRIVHGLRRNGFHHQPALQLVRMFNHQSPPDDLSRDFCKLHGVQRVDSVADALGGPQLDVDAVLLIVEHGDYPVNELGQVLYPRFELFGEVVDVFQRSGRSVPVFVDKHLSYDHTQAADMVRTARRLGFPLMAGSSLPVTWRIPEIEPPLGTAFREAVVTFGFDRGVPEIYLFHALEVLQCMLERRAGGESGVASVAALAGPAVWRAADEGRFSWSLLQAALGRSPSCNVGPVRENVRQPLAILVEYRDGTRGCVVNLIEQTSEFAFAAHVAGSEKIVSTHFYLPPPPGARFFDPLVYHIEQFFLSGRPPYPVQRTLLTSTVLDLALHSLRDGGRVVRSEALDIRYTPPQDSGFFRGPVTDDA